MPHLPWTPTPIDERATLAESARPASSAAASTISGASLRKPLKVIHRPSDSSQMKIGATAIPCQAVPASVTPRT